MKANDWKIRKSTEGDLPEGPGIYRFYNLASDLIYVGKAKNLRRRLGQYENAKRRKKHAKMRKIVAEAVRFETEICANEIEALKLENQWIRHHRPKWNVAGAFYFLYPMIGFSVEGEIVRFCYTTSPELFPNYHFHGAFRSRERTKDGFFAFMELLRFIGHPEPKAKANKQIRGTYLYAFRRVPSEWSKHLESFFRGETFKAVEELALLLLERPTALAHSAKTQENLRTLRLFWRHEILKLRSACEKANWKEYPVRQRDRDLVFISSKDDGTVFSKTSTPFEQGKDLGV
jgi:hypothetical protein